MPVTAESVAVSEVLRERRDGIAERVTSLYFEAHPQLEQRWKDARRKCTEDNRLHLDYLCEALSFGQPALFTEYAVWVAVLLGRLKIPGEALEFNLELLRTTLASELGTAGSRITSEYLDSALAKIGSNTKIGGALPEPPSHIEGNGPCDVLARNYLAALLQGDRHTASRLVLAAADSGTPVKAIYLLVFQRVQHEIGRLWQANRIGVAQEHYCSACTQSIMAQFYPRIFSANKNGRRLVATCVAGDLHEIGPRMVADFFELEGWDTFFLGANTPIAGTLQQLVERQPHVLAISATMPLHIHAVAALIAAVRATGKPPRILVGGAPFNSLSNLWRDVGADGCARDADEAIALANSWFR